VRGRRKMPTFRLPDDVRKTIERQWTILEGGHAATGLGSVEAALDFYFNIIDMEVSRKITVAACAGMLYSEAGNAKKFIEEFEKRILNAD
jgi:hypothetical protein